MAMGYVQQWGSGRSLAVLCLGVLCATASSVGAQPGKADPPSSLPEEIVRAWWEASRGQVYVGWMGLDKYGRLSFDKEATGLTGAVPAFRISSWVDGRFGWLAEQPVPLVPFGLDLGGTLVTDADVKELAGLKSLQTLNLRGTQVTDAGLKELAGLKSLQSLDLRFTWVTDAGLKELAGLKSLQWLDLGGTQVTDAGLKELAGLTSLQMLDLGGTQVTDAGLKELAGLKSLQRLDLRFTRVTYNGVAELRKASPGCNISY